MKVKRCSALEINWWRAHRERQYSPDPAEKGDELLESVTRLYCYLFGETEAAIRPAAVRRVATMDLSDQWVREGCLPDSPLLSHLCAALVRAARRRPPRVTPMSSGQHDRAVVVKPGPAREHCRAATPGC